MEKLLVGTFSSSPLHPIHTKVRKKKQNFIMREMHIKRNRSSSSRSVSCASVVAVLAVVMVMMMMAGSSSFPSVMASLPTPQPTEEKVFCLICKTGTMTMGTGSISGSLCQDLDMMGRESMFTQERCVELQTRAAQPDDPCGCHPTPGTSPIHAFMQHASGHHLI